MDCCKPRTVSKDNAICPGCGAASRDVKVRTLKHWLKTQFVHVVPDLPFRFCETRDCPVVYFSGDGSVRYTEEQLRRPVGIKKTDPSIPVCYCFGVTEEMIAGEVRERGKSTFSTWIAREMKQGNCACEVRNPSGRCCLPEVKKVEKMYAAAGKMDGRR